MKTITMEVWDCGDEGEFSAKIEINGEGDMEHFFHAMKSFLVAAGFDDDDVSDMMSEIAEDFESNSDWISSRLNFDRSENDE